MSDKSNLEQTRYAMDRLKLNSAKIMYCKRFNEKDIPTTVKHEIFRPSVITDESNQCNQWNTQRHSHNFLELIYFIDGQANIKGEKSEYRASPFNVIVYPEGIKHQELLNMNRHQEIICIGLQLQSPSKLKTVLSLKDQHNKLRWIFSELHHQYCIEDEKNHDIIYSLVRLIFFYIQQFLKKGGNTSTNRMEQAICYIRENFHTPITVEQLADFVNVSPTFLNNLFKKETGITPISYVNHVRVEIAKQLLLSADTSITIVCEQVGIEDPKYFSRLFKKIEGITPSKYVKTNMQRFKV